MCCESSSWVTGGREMPASTAAGTVLLDRLTGLMMLFTLALFALPFRPESFPALQANLIGSIALVGIAGGFLLMDGRLMRWLSALLPQKYRADGDGAIGNFFRAVEGCGWPAIWQALAVSLVFNLMLISWWFGASRALDLVVPFGHFFLAVPILSLSLLVPSIGGLGVRESIAPLLFGNAGISNAAAVALSLLELIVMRLSGLLGGLVYLYTILSNRGR